MALGKDQASQYAPLTQQDGGSDDDDDPEAPRGAAAVPEPHQGGGLRRLCGTKHYPALSALGRRVIQAPLSIFY